MLNYADIGNLLDTSRKSSNQALQSKVDFMHDQIDISTQAEALKFNAMLDVERNNLLKLKEENSFVGLQRDFETSVLQFQEEVTKNPDNFLHKVEVFENNLKQKYFGDLQLLSPEKKNVFEHSFMKFFSKARLSGIQHEKQVEIKNLQSNVGELENNLRTAVQSGDVAEIGYAKRRLEEGLINLNQLGVLTDQELESRVKNLDSNIFKQQAMHTVANSEILLDEMGEENYVNYLKEFIDSPEFSKLSLKEQSAFSKTYGQAVRLQDSTDLKPFFRNFQMSLNATFAGQTSVQDLDKSAERYYSKALKILPTLKAGQRKALKLQLEDARFQHLALHFLKDNPDKLLNSNPDDFIASFLQKDIKDIDKSSDDYLKALAFFQESRNKFGNFKTQEDIRSFTQSMGAETFEGSEQGFVKNARAFARDSVANFMTDASDEVKKLPGFQNLMRQTSAILNSTNIGGAVLGEKALTKAETDTVFDGFFGMLKANKHSDAIEFLNLFTKQKINVFKNMENSFEMSTQNLRTHFSILGQVKQGLSENLASNVQQGYTGFLNFLSGQTGKETKEQALKVYGSVKNKLTDYLDENPSEMESLEAIASNKEGLSSFLSSVFAYHVVANGVPDKVLKDDVSFEDFLEEGGEIASVFNAIKDTSVVITPNYSFNRGDLKNLKILENPEGDVEATVNQEGVTDFNKTTFPSEVKLQRTHHMIANSINPFDREGYALGKEGSKELTSATYAILKLAFPTEALSMRTLQNIKVRNGKVLYEEEDGILRQLSLVDPETGKKHDIQFSNRELQKFANKLDGPDDYWKEVFKNIDPRNWWEEEMSETSAENLILSTLPLSLQSIIHKSMEQESVKTEVNNFYNLLNSNWDFKPVDYRSLNESWIKFMQGLTSEK